MLVPLIVVSNVPPLSARLPVPKALLLSTSNVPAVTVVLLVKLALLLLVSARVPLLFESGRRCHLRCH